MGVKGRIEGGKGGEEEWKRRGTIEVRVGGHWKLTAGFFHSWLQREQSHQNISEEHLCSWFYHMTHMTVTWLSHDSHMTITLPHDYDTTHMTLTWLSHDYHMTVTWLSWLTWLSHDYPWLPHDYHTTHMTLTWLSHDYHMTHMTLPFSVPVTVSVVSLGVSVSCSDTSGTCTITTGAMYMYLD